MQVVSTVVLSIGWKPAVKKKPTKKQTKQQTQTNQPNQITTTKLEVLLGEGTYLFNICHKYVIHR